MAHIQQLNLVSFFKHQEALDSSLLDILEIGSYDPSLRLRTIFKGSRYTGVDLTSGPGVDIISSGHVVDLPDSSFDLTLSCECFEHNPFWVETLLNMHRLTKPGCYVLVTCATTGRLEHGTTRTSPHQSPGTSKSGWNYYRNLTKRDFERSLNLSNLFSDYIFLLNKQTCDLYFLAIKKTTSNVFKPFNRQHYLDFIVNDESSPPSRSPMKLIRRVIQFLPQPFYHDVNYYLLRHIDRLLNRFASRYLR